MELLRELIEDDLISLSDRRTNIVASEEAIRVIIKAYENTHQLINPLLIKISDVSDFIKSKLKPLESNHYQLILQLGHRSNIQQGNPDTIHYAALDLFIKPNEPIIAFVADHYKGMHYLSFYETFNTIKKELGNTINFIIAGGSLYQTDDKHCPIFTIQHLLLTAHDSQLRNMLTDAVHKQLQQDINAMYVKLPWFDLPPNYNLLAQSFVGSTLNYIKQLAPDTVSPDGTLIPSSGSRELIDCKFDELIERNLDVKRIENDELKLINVGIRNSAITLAHQAFLFLNNSMSYSESDLITLCYKDHHPKIYALLQNALDATEAADEGHPLFELVFNNAEVFNICLNNDNFNTLFNNKIFLSLLKLGHINVNDVFKKITQGSISNHEPISIVTRNIKELLNNLDFLSQTNTAIENGQSPDTSDTSALFLNADTSKLFKYTKIGTLYFSKKISKDILLKITPFSLSRTFDTMENQTAIEELNKLATLTKKRIIPSAKIDDTDYAFDLFGNVEENVETEALLVPPNEIPANNQLAASEKVDPNLPLVARALGQLGLFSEEKNIQPLIPSKWLGRPIK